LKLLVDMETGLRGYLLTNDNQFLDPYTQAQQVFDKEYQLLVNLVADDPAQTKRLNDAWTGISDWRQNAADTLANSAGDRPFNTADLLSRKQLMDSIRQGLADFVDAENRLRENRIANTQSNIQFVTLSVIAVGLVVGAILAVIILRQLIRLSQTYQRALDLSERHANELLLQQEWLRGVLTSIGDGVIATDMAGNITFINPITNDLTGWPTEEAVGNHITKVYKVEHVEVVTGQASPQDLTHSSNNTKQLIARDGSTIPIEDNLTYIKDSQGAPVGTVMVFRDISRRRMMEQKRAEMDALLETERQRLSNIIETVPGIFWENQYDAQVDKMRPVFVSAYIESMLGYTVDEALADPDFWYKLIAPEDLQKAIDEAAKFRNSGTTGIVSFRAIHKAGHYVDVDAHMMSIMDGDKSVGTRGVMMNVTERQRLLNAQTRYAGMLRRSNEQLQQFAYITSHDLQEPLRMVISYLQLLERRYANALDSDAHEFIAYAVDGAARMKELIAGLLQYSRLDGNQDSYEQVAVQEILDRALSNLSVAISDSRAQITHDPLPQLQADSLQLTQLFQNLIGNAIKFRGKEPPTIHVGAERKGEEWQFSIKDNGIGIAPEYQGRIFAIFQRLHTRTEYAGTGIGLAICKKIVERHNGRIWVESDVDKGSTFYFTMPVKPSHSLEAFQSSGLPHSY
jgi:PAS domain S-box-containing protein